MQLISANPRVLLWPGPQVTFAIADSSAQVRDVFPFSRALLGLLKYSFEPISSEKLDQILAVSGVEVTTKELLDKGLLVKSEDANPIDAWHGLRLTDLDGGFMRTNAAEPVVQERSVADLPLFVVDHLFSEDCIRAMASWFACQSFSLIDIDSDLTAFSRHWIRRLDPNSANLLSIPIFSWMDATSRHYFKSLNLNLAEAKAYITPYGDTPTYHRDSETGETITAILYLHPKWELDWGGELIISDLTGDPQIAVFPKAGRLVVFRGDLPHKAGAPSRLAFVPRQAIVLRYESQ